MKHNLIYAFYIVFIVALPIIFIVGIITYPFPSLSANILYSIILGFICYIIIDTINALTKKSINNTFNVLSDKADLYMEIYKGLSDDNEDHHVKDKAQLIHNLNTIVSKIDKYTKSHILILNKENWFRFEKLKSEIKDMIANANTKILI